MLCCRNKSACSWACLPAGFVVTSRRRNVDPCLLEGSGSSAPAHYYGSDD